MTATVFLVRRWLRSRGSRRSAVILVLAFALLELVFVSVSAFTPSADQQAASTFGRYEQQTYDSVLLGDLAPGFLAAAGPALASTVPGAHVRIETTALRPDPFAKTYVQAPIATVRFVEDPGLQEAFPGRYTLDQGSWPRSPFDVVVSRHVLESLPDPAQFTVLSGRATMHVVGVLTDSYARRGDTIVAGPDTWESIEPPAPGRQYQPVDAQVMVLFGAGTSIDAVGRGLQRLLPAAQGDRAEAVTANRSTRAELAGAPEAGFGTDQVTVSYLPLCLVVLLVSALVIGQTRGAHRADADRLVALGVRRSRVLLAQVVALVLVAAASIVAGLGLGLLVALAPRAAVLGSIANQQLGPVPGIDATMIAIAAASLVIIATGTVWPERSTAAVRSAVARYLGEVQIQLVRRVLVVVLVIGAVQVGDSTTSVVASYLAVAAVLLVGPDLLRLAVWIMPRNNARTFVIRRLMRADLGAQATAVVVVGACLAIPICVATQIASTTLSNSTFTYNRVPAHQIWVQNTGSTGDVAGVARVVSRVPEAGVPIEVRSLLVPAGPQGGGTYTLFGTVAPGGTDAMVLRSADELRRLVGPALPSRAEAVLDAGGVLDFSGAPGDQQFVTLAADGSTLRTSPVLPTLKVSLERQFTQQFSGAVLLDTVAKLQIPVSEPTKYIYPDAQPQVIAAAVAAAVDSGYDSEFVQYAVPPPPPVLPVAAYVFLAGLVLGGFAVLVAVIRGQARRLRSYSARLVAIGLGPRWTLSILGIQAAVTIGVGILAGVAAGILGVEITSTTYVVFDVPALPITVACAATALAAALATVLAVRALSAAEWPEVG